MKLSVILGFAALEASLVAAGYTDFKFYSKCSASSSSALWKCVINLTANHTA